MPNIKIFFDDSKIKEIKAPNGLSVMEIAHKNDIFEIKGACGGSLSCATCHVIIVEEKFYHLINKLLPKSEEEEDMLDLAFGLTKTSRLSCQIIMQDELNGLLIKIPKESE